MMVRVPEKGESENRARRLVHDMLRVPSEETSRAAATKKYLGSTIISMYRSKQVVILDGNIFNRIRFYCPMNHEFVN